MRLLIAYIFAGLIFLVSTAVWAGDLITSRSVFEDKTGTLTINEVIQADFQPTGELLAKGYTDAVHWVRLEVRAPQKNTMLELRIRPTFLDQITLYQKDPANADNWIISTTGDDKPYSQRERPGVTLGFVVNQHESEATYYLRLKTTSSSLMNVEALTPAEARSKDVYLDMFQALYVGLMLWLLFWAANDYVLNRQTVVGFFIIAQATYTTYALAIMGYFAALLPNASAGLVNQLTSVLVCLVTPVSLVFHRILLSLYAPPRLALRMIDSLICIGLIVLSMLMLGYARQALQTNSLIALLVAIVLPGVALMTRHKGSPGLVSIRTLYGLLALSLLVSILPLMGVVKATEWNLQSTLINGLVSAFLMFWLLYTRSHKLNDEAKKASLELALSNQQLQLAQLQRQQTERFVTMLSHELKTPISVISMGLNARQFTQAAQLRIKSALQDINAIVEHTQHVESIEQQNIHVKAEACNIEKILDELLMSTGEIGRFSVHKTALPIVTADPVLLRLSLSNLINNALKYSHTQSVIHISATLSQRASKIGVLIKINNTPGAAGLPDPDKLFTKYYRSAGAHRKTGSGLGLYLVKNYIYLLGGEVFYQEVDHQVEFSVWLPC